MKDFLKQEINVGDKIVISGGKTQYAGFRIFEVLKLTEKRVGIMMNKYHDALSYIHPSDTIVMTNFLETIKEEEPNENN